MATTSVPRMRCVRCGVSCSACDSTLEIAGARRALYDRGRELHALPGARGRRQDSWFIKEVEVSLRDRFERHPRRAQAGPITRKTSSFLMGFPGYFLTVADCINWAKSGASRGGPVVVRVPDRWSPAMKIHRVEPPRSRSDLRTIPQLTNLHA